MHIDSGRKHVRTEARASAVRETGRDTLLEVPRLVRVGMLPNRALRGWEAGSGVRAGSVDPWSCLISWSLAAGSGVSRPRLLRIVEHDGGPASKWSFRPGPPNMAVPVGLRARGWRRHYFNFGGFPSRLPPRSFPPKEGPQRQSSQFASGSGKRGKIGGACRARLFFSDLVRT